jgi:dienelactone hydrolase
VFLAQGTADTTVPPQITKKFGQALCKQCTRVSFILLNGVSHTFAAKSSDGRTLQGRAGAVRLRTLAAGSPA